MYRNTAIIAAAVALATSASMASSINHRQHHQDARIAQGIKSGELTHAEVKSLNAERRAVRTEERAYRADGQFTKVERKDVQQDLNQLSRDIHTQKHDGDTRW